MEVSYSIPEGAIKNEIQFLWLVKRRCQQSCIIGIIDTDLGLTILPQ